MDSDNEDVTRGGAVVEDAGISSALDKSELSESLAKLLVPVASRLLETIDGLYQLGYEIIFSSLVFIAISIDSRWPRSTRLNCYSHIVLTKGI